MNCIHYWLTFWRAFFTLALQAGLNACIINPASAEMMNAISAYNVLAGHDTGAMRYIARFGESPEQKPAPAERPNLQDMIIKGLKAESFDETNRLLSEQVLPLTIVNDSIIPALDTVGRRYESQTIFLPQLMMSAETAKASFHAISAYLESKGETRRKFGKIALATVAGDIHDIGKNIVKALLENYGYDVIDLGKDVKIDTIVQTVLAHDIKLVGLSALMTTTVINMERTIQAIRNVSQTCKIMVGGAVLNADYAKTIGADFYGKDALASVSIARQTFGNQ